jgi:hypothetical protein
VCSFIGHVSPFATSASLVSDPGYLVFPHMYRTPAQHRNACSAATHPSLDPNRIKLNQITTRWRKIRCYTMMAAFISARCLFRLDTLLLQPSPLFAPTHHPKSNQYILPRQYFLFALASLSGLLWRPNERVMQQSTVPPYHN